MNKEDIEKFIDYIQDPIDFIEKGKLEINRPSEMDCLSEKTQQNCADFVKQCEQYGLN